MVVILCVVIFILVFVFVSRYFENRDSSNIQVTRIRKILLELCMEEKEHVDFDISLHRTSTFTYGKRRIYLCPLKDGEVMEFEELLKDSIHELSHCIDKTDCSNSSVHGLSFRVVEERLLRRAEKMGYLH
jgi:hypothetical protein